MQGFWRSWLTGLLGVVKWRGVGVYLVGSSVWQGRPSLRRRREGLDQTGCCRCISDSLLAYRSKLPPATTMRCTIACGHNGSLVTSALVEECETEVSHGYMSVSSTLTCSDDIKFLKIIYLIQRHTKVGNKKQVLQSTPVTWRRRQPVADRCIIGQRASEMFGKSEMASPSHEHGEKALCQHSSEMSAFWVWKFTLTN